MLPVLYRLQTLVLIFFQNIFIIFKVVLQFLYRIFSSLAQLLYFILNVSDYRYCVEIVTWRAPRQPPYILTCRSILPADHRSHFSYLLPHHFHLLRVYIQSLQSYIHNQVVHAFPHTAKLTLKLILNRLISQYSFNLILLTYYLRVFNWAQLEVIFQQQSILQLQQVYIKYQIYIGYRQGQIEIVGQLTNLFLNLEGTQVSYIKLL